MTRVLGQERTPHVEGIATGRARQLVQERLRRERGVRAPDGAPPEHGHADVSRVELQALAHSASDAIARRITPYGSLFDGDVIFAVSTATTKPKSPMQLEALAALAVPEAVERSVRRG